MKIAVIGTGYVGRALGAGWSRCGHDVVFGSRTPQGEKATSLLQELGGGVAVTTPAEAAATSDVVVLAIPWNQAESIVETLGDLAGKTIVDCINPLNESFTGLDLGFHESAAERIAAWVPQANVVKAFNTVSAATMTDANYNGVEATVFYCGDNQEAKAAVAQLAADLGMEPVDAGPLQNARHLEPLAMLYIHLAVREGWGANCALKMMKR